MVNEKDSIGIIDRVSNVTPMTHEPLLFGIVIYKEHNLVG